MIGETYQLVVSEAQQHKDVAGVTQPFNVEGQVAFDVKYRNGDWIRHVFDKRNREVAFVWLKAGQYITQDEVGRIQRMFKTTWRSGPAEDGGPTWQSESGLWMWIDRGGKLFIFDMTNVDLRAASQNAPAAPPQPAPPPPATARPSETRNDCLIVATQALARLKPASAWARIAAFNMTDTQGTVGHAAVFFQPTADSNVMMYDARGSLDTGTQSHDLSMVLAWVNYKYILLERIEKHAAEGAKWLTAE